MGANSDGDYTRRSTIQTLTSSREIDEEKSVMSVGCGRKVSWLSEGNGPLFTSDLSTTLLGLLLVVVASLLLHCCDGGVASTPGEENTVPKGHLKPLGEQRPSEGFIEVVDGFPDPETFYTNYVLDSKPVLFKGAGHVLPAYERWSDTYLNKKYGEIMVDVEHGKKEDRKGNMEFMPLSQFLSLYKERDIYMVQDVDPQMMDDFILPRPIQCGGFQNTIVNAVLWFSSGGTKSVLHSDDMDNINCVLDGEKSLIMMDKKYESLVEDEHFVVEKSFSKVDVEKVDLYKHPALADVPYWKAHMERGDCLFIPYKWYHAVISSNTRNLAANLWMAHLAWFNKTDCVGCCEKTPKLSQVNVGESIDHIRHHVFYDFEGYDEIRLEDAVKKWQDIMAPATVQELYELMDTDKNMVLSWEEVFTADIGNIVRDFPELVGGVEDYEMVRDEL